MPRKPTRVASTGDDRADALNATGARKWGFRWLRANKAAVRVLSDAGLPANNRLLGMLIATAICETIDAEAAP